MLNALDPERRFEHVEAVAASGTGVFETLKMVSKLTLRTLRRRMTGEEPARPAPRRDAPTLRVREDGAPLTGRTTAGTTAVPAAPSTSPTVTAKLRATTTVEPSPFDEPPAAEPASTPPETFAEVDSRILSDAPVKPPNYRTGPVPAMSDAEVAEPEVKHVKVRSSVDVMAELEALRKRATQAPPKPARRSVEMPMPEGVTTPREVTRLLALIAAPGVLARSRTLRITVSFEDSERGVIQTQEHSLDLGATSDLQSVTVNLKIDQA
jgi:hypothetical protein